MKAFRRVSATSITLCADAASRHGLLSCLLVHSYRNDQWDWLDLARNCRAGYKTDDEPWPTASNFATVSPALATISSDTITEGPTGFRFKCHSKPLVSLFTYGANYAPLDRNSKLRVKG